VKSLGSSQPAEGIALRTSIEHPASAFDGRRRADGDSVAFPSEEIRTGDGCARVKPTSAHEEDDVMDPGRSSARTLEGRCLCGAVRYAVHDEFLYALYCHCSNCRRTTGAAFKPFAGIERDKLRVVQGETNLMTFGDGPGRDIHCDTCGSLLYSIVRAGAFVHVSLGTLVDDPSIRPSAHIFVGSKAPWFAITDDLPQFVEHVGAAGA
jgi:hypothetical protein